MKTLILSIVAAAILTACSTDADVVSHNLSMEAGEFKLNRRIVFYNGITDTYILTVEGLCQVDHAEKMAVTCKTGADSYKKHYLGLSDNVTYFSEQLDSAGVGAYRYRVVFRPESIIPDVDLRTSRDKP